MARRLKLLVVCISLIGASSTFADSFTLDPPSPTLGLLGTTAGSILFDVPGPPVGGVPSVGTPFGAMGLVAGDVVDAISDGFDPVFAPHVDYFSVTRGSVGVAGSGVFIESLVADTPPGVTPGHAGDIFVAGPGVPAGTNILAPPTFGWTMGTTTGDEANAGLFTPTAPPAIGDNVNSYDLSFMPPPAAKYFSLAAGSPTLVALGATPADILAVGGPFGPLPVVILPAFLLSLPLGADMDALALFTGGGPFLGPGSIEYSLTPASAALLGLSGADILGLTPGPVGPPGSVVGVVHTAASIGLLFGDDLDALDVDTRAIPEPGGFAFMGLSGLLVLALCVLRGLLYHPADSGAGQ